MPVFVILKRDYCTPTITLTIKAIVRASNKEEARTKVRALLNVSKRHLGYDILQLEDETKIDLGEV